MAHKIDFKKTLKQLYNPSIHQIHLVDVPEMNFLMVDGIGNPNSSPEYQQAIEALYTMSYGIKFAFKAHGYDHVVPPLEGLWWMENMRDFSVLNKDQWKWTMMIMQPDWVSAEWVEETRNNAVKKKSNPSLSLVRFENYHEGLCVQTLYRGAYADEAPTIADMHEYIRVNSLLTNGKHHEIYLGDPRKISPEKLITILRQPVRKE
jgi:hypothetical protein